MTMPIVATRECSFNRNQLKAPSMLLFAGFIIPDSVSRSLFSIGFQRQTEPARPAHLGARSPSRLASTLTIERACR